MCCAVTVQQRRSHDFIAAGSKKVHCSTLNTRASPFLALKGIRQLAQCLFFVLLLGTFFTAAQGQGCGDLIARIAAQLQNSGVSKIQLPGGLCTTQSQLPLRPGQVSSLVVLVGAKDSPTLWDTAFRSNVLGFSSGNITDGVVVAIQDMTLLNTALDPSSILNITAINGNVQLTNVTVVTDCLSLYQQQQHSQSQSQWPMGADYLIVPEYQDSYISASNVTVRCDWQTLTSNSSGSINSSQVPSLLLNSSITYVPANDTLSLFNALVAVNYLYDRGNMTCTRPASPNATEDPSASVHILVQGDISVDALFWRGQVELRCNIVLEGVLLPQAGTDAGTRYPMLDWQGHKQLILLTNLTSCITFQYLDHMNAPPLTGVYLAGVGQVSLFTLPLWVVWADPAVWTSSRLSNNTSLVHFHNSTFVVPPEEYAFFNQYVTMLLSPAPDVAAASAWLHKYFQEVTTPDSNVGVTTNNNTATPYRLPFLRLRGLGIHCSNFAIVPQPPSYISIPQMWRDAHVPVFTVKQNDSMLDIAGIAVYAVEDLMQGLEQLQEQQVQEHVSLVLLRNISLANVTHAWPAQGYLLNKQMSIAGLPPFTYPNVPYTVLDLAQIPYFIGFKPAVNLTENRIFLWGLFVINMATTSDSPYSSGAVTLPSFSVSTRSLTGPVPSNLTLYQDATIVVVNASIVLPYADYSAVKQLVNANTTDPRLLSNYTFARDYNEQDWLYFGGAARFAGWLGVGNIGILHAGTKLPWKWPFPITYNDATNALTSTQGGSSGISPGQAAGIAVGSAVGGVAIISVTAYMLLQHLRRARQQQLGTQSREASGGLKELKPSMDEEEGGSNGCNVLVVEHGGGSGLAVGNDKSTTGTGTDTPSGGHKVSGASSDHDSVKLAVSPAAEMQQVLSALVHDIGDEHLVLLDAVGQGGFGTVYKGMWKGLMVAVKTITFQDRMVGGGKAQQTAIMEAAISTSLAHPYVVLTYSYDIKPLKVQAGGTGDTGLRITANSVVTDWKLYIIQEFCDAGSLRQAVLRRKMWDDVYAGPNLEHVLECAIELAAGLQHLHSKNIIHGDLNPNNVLLKKDPRSSRGVVCKLCDFGLSVKMGQGQSHISNMRRGTPFYTAPEVMSQGNMTKAADAFSFGVMLWELIHSQTCYRVLPNNTFLQRENFPAFIPACPVSYAQLAEKCMSPDLATRPSMTEVVEQLEVMQKLLMQGRLITCGLSIATPPHLSQGLLPAIPLTLTTATAAAKPPPVPAAALHHQQQPNGANGMLLPAAGGLQQLPVAAGNHNNLLFAGSSQQLQQALLANTALLQAQQLAALLYQQAGLQQPLAAPAAAAAAAAAPLPPPPPPAALPADTALAAVTAVVPPPAAAAAALPPSQQKPLQAQAGTQAGDVEPGSAQAAAQADPHTPAHPAELQAQLPPLTSISAGMHAPHSH